MRQESMPVSLAFKSFMEASDQSLQTASQRAVIGCPLTGLPAGMELRLSHAARPGVMMPCLYSAHSALAQLGLPEALLPARLVPQSIQAPPTGGCASMHACTSNSPCTIHHCLLPKPTSLCLAMTLTMLQVSEPEAGCMCLGSRVEGSQLNHLFLLRIFLCL